MDLLLLPSSPVVVNTFINFQVRRRHPFSRLASFFSSLNLVFWFQFPSAASTPPSPRLRFAAAAPRLRVNPPTNSCRCARRQPAGRRFLPLRLLCSRTSSSWPPPRPACSRPAAGDGTIRFKFEKAWRRT